MWKSQGEPKVDRPDVEVNENWEFNVAKYSVVAELVDVSR